MTPEQFHDALTLLPADLVAEADKKRRKPQRIIPWKPYAAAAACLCLVLLGGWLTGFRNLPGMAKQAASEESVMLQGSGNTGYDAAAPEAPAAIAEAAPAEEEMGEIRAESAAEDNASANTNTAMITSASTLYPGITLMHTLEAFPDTGTACYSSTPDPVVLRSRAELESYAENSIRFQRDNLLAFCTDYDKSWFETHDLLLVTTCGIPVGEIPEIADIRHYENQWKFVFRSSKAAAETGSRDWHFLLAAEKGLVGEAETLLSTTALSGEDILFQQSHTPHSAGENPSNQPETWLVTSRAQLDGYFAEYADFYDFTAMVESCTAYDENWFADHDLLLILMEASRPNNRWTVVDITKGSRWDWEILVYAPSEHYPGQEEDCLHLLVELEKHIISPEDSIIRVTEPQPGT